MNHITWGIDPVLFEIGTIHIRYYSVLFVLGIFLASLVVQKIYSTEKMPEELFVKLRFYEIVGIIIGARLGHCLFYDAAYYLAHPLEMLLPISKTADGEYVLSGYAGLASHGGAIGVITATLLYTAKTKIPLWWPLDNLAIATPLAAFFIRVANFMNSEIIGSPTNMPWGIVFKNVDNIPRHPSQLYEAVTYILIFFLIVYLFKKYRSSYPNGFIFGLVITLIFSFRFFIEFFKEVQVEFEQALILDMGQILSIPFVIAGITIIIMKRPEKDTYLKKWKYKPSKK